MDWDTAAKVASLLTPTILLAVVHFIYRSNTIAQETAKRAEEAFGVVNTNAAAAAEAVKQVETTLAQTAAQQGKATDHLIGVAEATHTLANGVHGIALLNNVNNTRNIERLTVKPEDKKAARAAVVEAERLYADHQAKQAVVDAGATTAPAQKPRRPR